MTTVANRTVLSVSCLVGAVMATGGAAVAQSDTAAQALFDEGKRLLQRGDVAAACEKLAESQRIEPAGGTLINLAACHAREGKTATAWAEFNDALTQARRDRRNDRVDEATRQIAQLEPHLARLTVTVEAGSPPGLEVKVDGVALGPASWGTAIPVDPGDHDVRASAPGHDAWTSHVSIVPETGVRVAVPALAATRSDGATTPDSRVPSTPVAAPAGGPSPVAYVLLGLALVGGGVGTYFGIVAVNKKHDSESDCVPAGCTSDGASLLRQADTAAWVTDVALGVGIAAAVGAVVVYVRTRGAPPAQSSLRLAPAIGLRSAGFGLVGTW